MGRGLSDGGRAPSTGRASLHSRRNLRRSESCLRARHIHLQPRWFGASSVYAGRLHVLGDCSGKVIHGERSPMSVEENKALIRRLYSEVFVKWNLGVVD